MCGIFFLSKPDLIIAESAAHILNHRGPDQESVIVDDTKTVVFQRLAINDATGGHQPMIDSTRKILFMCNGEIFNYREVANSFDIKCETQSDCEVVFQMYKKNVLLNNIGMLNGDFAICIIDEDIGEVLVSRDRIGVRPLFFGFTESNQLCIASEAKSMWMCSGVEHVLPGSIIKFDLNNMGSVKYLFYPNVFSDEPRVEKNLCNMLRSRLETAVKARLMSDRPMGCLLSGGLDSSIVCAILCRLIGPENVRTYSIGMQGSLDLQYAQKVANYLHTVHTEVLFTPEQGLAVIPEVIYALESYDITTVRASVPMYLLSKYISKNSSDVVIFSGEGSDELFCGYLYFHDAPTASAAHNESLRLIYDLYKYDCLRADRCVAAHGLELRVPFLDKDVINFCTQVLTGEDKIPKNGIEKRILREAFIGYLPDEVLWRRKDGFSDGVSSTSKSWYEYIREYVENVVHITDKKNCISTEAYYYKTVYDRYFPFYPKPIDYYWMPRWSQSNDPTNPSGRILKVFQE